MLLSSRWLVSPFLLLLLKVLPSICDYESWKREEELREEREAVSWAMKNKEETKERVAQV